MKTKILWNEKEKLQKGKFAKKKKNKKKRLGRKIVWKNSFFTIFYELSFHEKKSVETTRRILTPLSTPPLWVAQVHGYIYDHIKSKTGWRNWLFKNQLVRLEFDHNAPVATMRVVSGDFLASIGILAPWQHLQIDGLPEGCAAPAGISPWKQILCAIQSLLSFTFLMMLYKNAVRGRSTAQWIKASVFMINDLYFIL